MWRKRDNCLGSGKGRWVPSAFQGSFGSHAPRSLCVWLVSTVYIFCTTIPLPDCFKLLSVVSSVKNTHFLAISQDLSIDPIPLHPRVRDGSRWGHCSLLQVFLPQLSQPHSLRQRSPAPNVCADSRILSRMLERESESSAMGVLRGSKMLHVPSRWNKWDTWFTPREAVPLSFQFAEQMTWLKNAQLTGRLQCRLPFWCLASASMLVTFGNSSKN